MKIHVSKKRWYMAIINCILALLAVLCAVVFFLIAGKLDTIRAAERWRGENPMRFSQIGCYMPVDGSKTEEEILSFRRILDQKLLDASLDGSDVTLLYADAYSGQSKMTVTGDHGKAEVNAIGVGGEFFLFHPLHLCSGSYISGKDLMQDRVVLDEALAWQLFGSSNVAGMTVQVGDKPLYVAGVVQRENDYASSAAYGEKPTMFVSYSAFYALTEAGITSYEIVMPDMISGFAKNIVAESFDVGTGDIVENSTRFSISNLCQVIKDFGVRSMRHNGVIYPYWENAVRMTEDHLALLFVLIIVFASCPAVTACFVICKALVSAYRHTTKSASDKMIAARERKREERYAKIGEK